MGRGENCQLIFFLCISFETTIIYMQENIYCEVLREGRGRGPFASAALWPQGFKSVFRQTFLYPSFPWLSFLHLSFSRLTFLCLNFLRLSFLHLTFLPSDSDSLIRPHPHPQRSTDISLMKKVTCNSHVTESPSSVTSSHPACQTSCSGYTCDH